MKIANTAEIIVVAEVVKPDTSITFWSGFLASTKQVSYRVTKVLKGTVNSKKISVGHFVVFNSFTADKEDARLSPALFKKGNELILLLSKEEDKLGCKQKEVDSTLETFCSPNENYGVRPFTPELVKKVEQAVRK